MQSDVAAAGVYVNDVTFPGLLNPGQEPLATPHEYVVLARVISGIAPEVTVIG